MKNVSGPICTRPLDLFSLERKSESCPVFLVLPGLFWAAFDTFGGGAMDDWCPSCACRASSSAHEHRPTRLKNCGWMEQSSGWPWSFPTCGQRSSLVIPARSMPTKLSGLGKHSWESRPRAGPAAGHWWPSERHDKIGADLKWASSGPAVAQQMNLCRVL